MTTTMSVMMNVVALFLEISVRIQPWLLGFSDILNQ